MKGCGFAGMLTIAFIVLKLIGQIDWSWWWVLSPMLISLGLLLVVVIVVSILDYKSPIDYKSIPKEKE